MTSPVNRLQFDHLSDVIVQVEGKSLGCHKIQLAKASSVFDAMFKNNWEEAGEKRTIKMDNFTAETVTTFINYLYTGKTTEESLSSTKLLAIAHQYQVDDLFSMCANHLLTVEVTFENAVELWETAEVFDLEKLKGFVDRFLAAKWSSRDNIQGLKELVTRRSDYIFDFIAYLVKDVRSPSS